jgi:hypothetical protein
MRRLVALGHGYYAGDDGTGPVRDTRSSTLAGPGRLTEWFPPRRSWGRPEAQLPGVQSPAEQRPARQRPAPGAQIANGRYIVIVLNP